MLDQVTVPDDAHVPREELEDLVACAHCRSAVSLPDAGQGACSSCGTPVSRTEGGWEMLPANTQFRAVAEHLPFRDRAFDRVIFVTTLDHFVDPGAPLALALSNDSGTEVANHLPEERDPDRSNHFFELVPAGR